jgi:hypothetical protein
MSRPDAESIYAETGVNAARQGPGNLSSRVGFAGLPVLPVCPKHTTVGGGELAEGSLKGCPLVAEALLGLGKCFWA